MREFFLIVIFVFLYSAVCNSEEEKARVVDKDRPHIGVKSKIKVKNIKGVSELVSQTDNNGYVIINYECKQLEVAIFLPENDSYYSETVDCPVKINPIKLTSIVYSTNLIINAEKKLSVGEYGAAAWALTDAAVRLRKSDPEAANNIEKRSFNAAGIMLKVKFPVFYDPKQNKHVMSSALRKAVLKYQEIVGLETSGKLNTSTLKSLSNTSLSAMLFSVPEQK